MSGTQTAPKGPPLTGGQRVRGHVAANHRGRAGCSRRRRARHSCGRALRQPVRLPFHELLPRVGAAPPRYPVTLLPSANGKKLAAELAADGYADLTLAPADRITDFALKRIYDAPVSGVPYWNAAGAKAEIDAWARPRHFLDFETAVPIRNRSSPYDRAPFQFSCTRTTPTTLRRTICFSISAATTQAARAMRRYCSISVTPAGSSATVHSKKTTIRWLAKRFPDLGPQLTMLADRVIDLLLVVKANFYDRDMISSYSIKNVQRVLAMYLDYDALGETGTG
jgi:hypothetical protein